MDTPTPWDAIVVGGGPAGLSAALLLGRSRRRTLVIDAGEPRNRFAAHIHGLLGNEDIAPAELTHRGRREVAGYGVEFAEGTVDRVEDVDGGLALTLADGRRERTRALIVATGLRDDLPDIPGLAERWGRTVLHCPFCHGWEVRDRHLAVLATSPFSLHQAQLIRQWSDRLTVFSAALGPLDPAVERRLRSRGIALVPSPVVAVLGDGERIEGVRTAEGAVTEVDAIFTGGRPVPLDDFLDGLGLARADGPMGTGSFLAVDATGRTSHPRVWAVGNVVNPGANVPLSIGTGSFAGAGVNGALLEEDFDRALTDAGVDA